MEETSVLPAVNAFLNSVATICLLLGLRAIKAGRRETHERFMLSAFGASALFLASYSYYHFVVVPELGHTPFNRPGLWKTAYLVMLASHILLAIVNLPMVLRTLWLARKERWESHKRLARWTFPIWLYVSVTGVLIYVLLYHFNPPALVD
jgi:putative membrane protein